MGPSRESNIKGAKSDMNWQRLRLKYWRDLFGRKQLNQDLDEEIAENDREGATEIQEAVRASKNPRSALKIYPGAEHGVPLFDKHSDLKPAILKWLQTELR